MVDCLDFDTACRCFYSALHTLHSPCGIALSVVEKAAPNRIRQLKLPRRFLHRLALLPRIGVIPQATRMA
jgi:hypothetical protein